MVKLDKITAPIRYSIFLTGSFGPASCRKNVADDWGSLTWVNSRATQGPEDNCDTML